MISSLSAPDETKLSHVPLLILACGMALRVLWALVIPVDPVSDSWAYYTFARVLAEHGVYGWTAEEPTAYWAVGTSALIAAGYYLFGETSLVVIGLNLIASIAAIWLTWCVGTRLFGARAGLIAMALVAFWPNLIMFTTVVSSELFFIALSLAAVWLWLLRDERGMLALILAGLFFAAATYVRPIALLLPVMLWMVTWPRGLRYTSRALLQAAVMVGMIILCAMPWTMRNKSVIGADAMISTNFGANLWMGNNPVSTGGYMDPPPEAGLMSEADRADYLKALAKGYMLENPLQTAGRTLVKALKLHNRETIGVVWNERPLVERIGDRGLQGLKLLATGYWFLLVLSAIAGIVVLGRRGGWRGALFNEPLAIWSYVTLIHAIIVVEDRYHMPASPWIAILAGVALASCMARKAESSQT